MNTPRKVAFFTLGCKLNFAETSTIARLFGNDDFERVDFSTIADIYIINTCSVTEIADKKCRQAIKKAIKLNPAAIVVVLGCYAQLKPEEVAKIQGVDLVLGANEKFNVLEYLNQIEKKASLQKEKHAIIESSDIEQVNQFFPSFSMGDRTRSFLKIQDGCDYHCSYCTIPLARGKSRNSSIALTLEEARKIAVSDIKEVILTGVNIGDFGRTTDEKFIDLIRELDRIEGIERFRISSIEPNLITNEVIQFVTTSQRFVPHFHIPLQSGSDKILKLMRRRYLRDLYADRVNQIKTLIPDACIGVDVIVGFPNESDEDFMDMYEFLSLLPISYLHVFTYSERPNTDAILIENKVDSKEKNRRSKLLHVLSEKKRRAFYEQNKGKTYDILFEAEHDKKRMIGFTPNYIKVETKYNENLVNQVVKATLIEINLEGNFEICF